MGLPHSKDTAAYLASLDCVHCGLCIEHCPTYLQTGRESANPRGRIYLMRALMEKRQEPTPAITDELNLCLVCRACESACPSGVQFGEVMAATRSEIRKRGFLRRTMMSALHKPRLLRVGASLLRFYQRSGLRVLRHVLPRRLKQMEAYLPPIPTSKVRKPLPQWSPAVGPSKGTVALLEGCVMPIFFQDVNRDTMRLLQAAGFDVIVPQDQTCCGALHEHDGDLTTAKRLLETNANAFQDTSILALVSNSSGCGAGLQSAAHHLDAPKGRALASKVVDLSRFLVDHGERLSFQETPLKVTYDAPCHLYHAQKETKAPLLLLKRIPGLQLIPLPEADRCCGAAGIYNLDQPEMSASILSEKLDALESTGAKVLVTGNPGCLLQWRQGVKQRGLDIEVIHLATLLMRTVIVADR
jgi:glycolate oxidase iron-sulfur subunit